MIFAHSVKASEQQANGSMTEAMVVTMAGRWHFGCLLQTSGLCLQIHFHLVHPSHFLHSEYQVL